MGDVGMWIDHQRVGAQSGDAMTIENPATEEPIGRVPRARATDVDRAVAAARRAQPLWRRMPGLDKAKLLHEVAARLRAIHREVADLMTQEGGKPMIENLDEIDWTAACFDYYAELGRHSRGSVIPPSFEHQVNFTVKEPYGVVAAIVPFNYPLLLMAWKVAPALAAGNTVIIKPAHQTPLATLELARAFEVLPPGVVSIVTGLGDEAGEPLVAHPGVDLIAFTGSTATGKKILRLAAETFKKTNMETSGIDPFIVCEDADLDVAVRGAVWARYLNAGQVCTSAKRFYVVDAVADAFVERFVELAEQLVVGDPRRPDTDMGPVISRTALSTVQEAIERAVHEGSRLVAGGGRPSHLTRGHFLEPTVLDHVRHGTTPTRQEVFGPVAAMVRVRDVDEAIALANDSEYGLGANIYTNNLRWVMRAMEEIKAGTFWVNDPLTDNEAGPFGGMRRSGIGRELGEEGLDAFREPKHVHIDYVQERKSYWFPYADRQW
ncbi:MAG TPA: aldehyde dehydrogenase family protein [Gemmatimonadales bacterium]|nr:aldehyde dehydrogenase family protein [Gemmatimonadales bacterium]